MEMPTITDWIQATTSVIALVLAVASLIWQWRSQRAANAIHLSAKATAQRPDIWSLYVGLGSIPTNHSLRLRVSVVKPKQVKLFDPSQLPYERVDDGGISFAPRINWSKYVDVKVDEPVEVEVTHLRQSPDFGEAKVGLAVPPGTPSCRVRMTLLEPHRDRVLTRKTMLISPIR